MPQAIAAVGASVVPAATAASGSMIAPAMAELMAAQAPAAAAGGLGGGLGAAGGLGWRDDRRYVGTGSAHVIAERGHAAASTDADAGT